MGKIFTKNRKNLRKWLFAEGMLLFVLFTNSYVSVRILLPVLLHSQGVSTNNAYALVVTFISVAAIMTIIWGRILSAAAFSLRGSQTLILLALAFNGLGLLALGTHHYLGFGIAICASASPLFIVALYTQTNRLFLNNETATHKANNIQRFALNLGALFGFLTYFLSFHYASAPTAYLINATTIFVSVAAAFIALRDIRIDFNVVTRYTLYLLISAVVADLTLKYADDFRYVVLVVYIASLFYAYFLTTRHEMSANKNFGLFLITLSTVFVYWLGSAMLSVHLPMFLAAHAKEAHYATYLSPALILVIDPLANLVLGYPLANLYVKLRTDTNTVLKHALLLISFAFFCFTIGVSLFDYHLFYFSSFVLILSLMSFGAAEFILITTAMSQINTLFKSARNTPFYLAIIRASSAFAASISYYIIADSKLVVSSFNLPYAQDYGPYFIILVISVVVTMLFCGIKRETND